LSRLNGHQYNRTIFIKQSNGNTIVDFIIVQRLGSTLSHP
jgi:hypothetical protein